MTGERDPQAAFVKALEASRLLEIHRAEIAELDPAVDPVPEITKAFREERDLMDEVALAIGGQLDELAEAADEVATDLYRGIAEAMNQADQYLGALRSLAVAVEQWAELSQREARVDFGSDLVEAARHDLRTVLVPLPVLELGERRKV